MAKPRIFISSTFYDLRQVRADLNAMINDIGYDVIRNEDGSIPYGQAKKLEEYCYKEIEGIDILVAIIGGRFGANSNTEDYSITQMEIRTALEKNKQVYIFIEQNVANEYETYLLNKDNDQVRYRFVDDIRIFQFIEQIKSLPKNNTIFEFKTAQEISSYLKKQWAGLFQSFLQESSRIKEYEIVKGLEATSRTLDQLVKYLTEERRGANSTITTILLYNHPLFDELIDIFELKYRIILTTFGELRAWLEERDYYYENINNGMYVWTKELFPFEECIKISCSIFENDKLIAITKDEWSEDHFSFNINDLESAATEDEDLPF